MCGIAGIVDYRLRQENKCRVQSMMDVIRYRGPDGNGIDEMGGVRWVMCVSLSWILRAGINQCEITLDTRGWCSMAKSMAIRKFAEGLRRRDTPFIHRETRRSFWRSMRNTDARCYPICRGCLPLQSGMSSGRNSLRLVIVLVRNLFTMPLGIMESLSLPRKSRQFLQAG